MKALEKLPIAISLFVAPDYHANHLIYVNDEDFWESSSLLNYYLGFHSFNHHLSTYCSENYNFWLTESSADGQIPYLCDTLDEGLVTREFEYFKIPLTPREFGPEPSAVEEEIRFVVPCWLTNQSTSFTSSDMKYSLVNKKTL